MVSISLIQALVMIVVTVFTVRVAYFVHNPSKQKELFAKYKHKKNKLAYRIYKKTYSGRSLGAWVGISVGWMLFFVSSVLRHTTQAQTVSMVIGGIGLIVSFVGLVKLSSLFKEERARLKSRI